MSNGLNCQKIPEERNQRNKSSYIWKKEITERIKLEVGSSIRPEPYCKKTIKTYIHEFLEHNNALDDIDKYGLNKITIIVLDITRTFIDKIMAVKRHAMCGSLLFKVRHIYDVVRLYQTDEIRKIYEGLHIDLLYTNDKQDFTLAIKTFQEINELLCSIEE